MKKNTKKITPSERARKFVDYARKFGFSYSVRVSVVTVSKRITIGDAASFAEAETEASILLHDCCPHKGGSVWGTDGGSIGGAVAMSTGCFKMNKSGSGGKSFAKAVAKLYAKQCEMHGNLPVITREGSPDERFPNGIPT
jgi:hypothetical protein